MKSTLTDRVDAAKYSYVGRRACGCVTALCVDIPGEEHHTARFVREQIADLATVEHVTMDEGRKLIQAAHICGKKFAEVTASAYRVGYQVKNGTEFSDRKFTAIARNGKNYIVIWPDELALKPTIEGV